MSDEAQTRPTLETVVLIIGELRAEMRERLDRIETQLDRTSAATYETRADLRELKRLLREHFHVEVK